jgi:hypothetical protein
LVRLQLQATQVRNAIDTLQRIAEPLRQWALHGVVEMSVTKQ